MNGTKEKKFAEAVERLETIVEQLEQEEVSLEDSFKLFEEGIELAKFCSVKLDEAEKKFEELAKGTLSKPKTIPVDNVDE